MLNYGARPDNPSGKAQHKFETNFNKKVKLNARNTYEISIKSETKSDEKERKEGGEE